MYEFANNKVSVIFLAMLLIVNTAACSNIKQNIPPVARATLNFQNEEEERRFFVGQIIKYHLEQENPKKMQKINKILCKLSFAAGLDKCVPPIYIKTNKLVFPYAFKKTIVIPSSIALLEEDHIAFILGHEVSHISLGHTKKETARNFSDKYKFILANYEGVLNYKHAGRNLAIMQLIALVAVSSKAMGKSDTKDMGTVAKVLIIPGLYYLFAGMGKVVEAIVYEVDQKMELEADKNSILLMGKAGFNKASILEVFSVFNNDLENESQDVLDFKMHPTYKRRIKALKVMLETISY